MMPRTKKIIDPTNLRDNEPIILGTLLRELLLKKKIQRFQRGESYPVTVSGTDYDVMLQDEYEIYFEKDNTFRIKGKMLGAGGQTEIFEAGKIKLQEDGRAVFTPIIPDYHERIIRRSKQSVSDFDVIKNQADVATKVKRLHSKVTAIQESDGSYTIYTVMRKFKGRDLYKILQEDDPNNTPYNPLPIETRFELTRKILQAMDEQVRRLGLVHRDIKPENIVVDIDAKGKVNSVHIIDYDFAKEDNGELDDEIHGTRQYLSPEAMLQNTTHQSDMFALSMVLGWVWRGKLDDLTRPIPPLPTKRRITREEYIQLFHNTFKPNFRPDFGSIFTGISSDFDFGEQGAIDRDLLQPMGEPKVGDRSTIEDALNAWKKIEVAHAQKKYPNAEKGDIEQAHKNAYAMRETLINLSDQFAQKEINLDEFLADLQKQLDDMSTFIKAAESKKSAAVIQQEYLSIIDCRAFDNVNVNDPKSFKETADKLMATFRDNHKKLKELIDSGIESYHPEALKEAKRLMKKVEKCTTIDDMNDFNNTFQAKILVIFNKQKKEMEKTFKEEIQKAVNCDDLKKILSDIKKEENQFIRKEQGTVFKFFSEFGSTTTWQHIIDELQEKALGSVKKEMKNIPEDGTKNEKMAELLTKYAELFSEKSGRVFHNQFAKEFAELQKKHPIRRPT